MSKEAALKVVGIIALVIGGGFLFLGLSVFFAPSITDTLVQGAIPTEALIPIGIVVAVIAGIGTVGAIGLFYKNNYCRYMVIFISLPLWFFVFPFALALVLSRKDIKEMFLKEDREVN